MQFLVTAYDGKDDEALSRRMKVRDAHVRLGNQMRDQGQLLYGVAILDGSQKMIGSVYIVDLPSREAVDDWLKVEPYVIGNVWERIEVLPCKVGPSFTRA